MRARTFACSSIRATDAFFLHDELQVVRAVNRQACESLGYGRGELIGQHPREFDVGLDAQGFTRVGERVRSGETVTLRLLTDGKAGACSRLRSGFDSSRTAANTPPGPGARHHGPQAR